MREQHITHVNICARLNLDQQSKVSSWSLIQNVLSHNKSDITKPANGAIFASAVWVVGQVLSLQHVAASEPVTTNGVALSQIVTAANIP